MVGGTWSCGANACKALTLRGYPATNKPNLNCPNDIYNQMKNYRLTCLQFIFKFKTAIKAKLSWPCKATGDLFKSTKIRATGWYIITCGWSLVINVHYNNWNQQLCWRLISKIYWYWFQKRVRLSSPINIMI